MMEGQYNLLITSLKNLGLPYEDQVKGFPDFVDVMDEIISDFDNAFHLLPQIMDEKKIPYDAVSKILHCYLLIDLNMTIPERTTNESFKMDEFWVSVRAYANEALRLINSGG